MSDHNFISDITNRLSGIIDRMMDLDDEGKKPKGHRDLERVGLCVRRLRELTNGFHIDGDRLIHIADRRHFAGVAEGLQGLVEAIQSLSRGGGPSGLFRPIMDYHTLLITLKTTVTDTRSTTSGDEQSTVPPTPVDLESQAIAMLLTIGPNVARIARQLSVPRTTLYGWAKFKDALSRVHKTAPRRGKRSGDRDFELQESDE